MTVQDTIVRSLFLVRMNVSFTSFSHGSATQAASPCDCGLDYIKCLQNDLPSVQHFSSAQIISAAKLLPEHLWHLRCLHVFLSGTSSREWDACIPGCEYFPLLSQSSLDKTGSFMTSTAGGPIFHCTCSEGMLLESWFVCVGTRVCRCAVEPRN